MLNKKMLFTCRNILQVYKFLIIVYIVKTPTIVLSGGFVVGYSEAGGVLQMAVATINDMFPTIKGTITSVIMIASSLANYAVLSVAGGYC